MPTGYISFDNIAVAPTPPGVFATSMPSTLATENYEPVPKTNLHNSGLVSCPVLPHSLPSPTCAFEFSSQSTKSSDSVILCENESNSYASREKQLDNHASAQRQIQSGGKFSRYSKISSPQFNTERENASSRNKSLKVTIRRAPDSHSFGGNHSQEIMKQEISANPKLGILDPTKPIPSLFQTKDKFSFPTRRSSDSNKESSDVVISSKIGRYTKQEKPSETYNYNQKIKSESCLQKDASTSTDAIASTTVPDSRGPCEAGSKIVFEGVVWLETPGMIVINAHWRGRPYLGTLLDSSKSTLGPSCPDKMISALSLVKRRQMWNARSNHRNSSRTCVHKNSIYSNSTSISSSCDCQNTGNGGGGAAMTTRAAAAAAAAASERSGSDADANSGQPLESTFRKRGGALSSNQRAVTTKRKRMRGFKLRSESEIVKTNPTEFSSANSPIHTIEFDCATTTSIVTAERNRIFAADAQNRDSQPDHQVVSSQMLESLGVDYKNLECASNAKHINMMKANINMNQSDTVNVNESANHLSNGLVCNKIPTKHSDNENAKTIRKALLNNNLLFGVQLPPCLTLVKPESTATLSYPEDDDQPPPQLDRGPGTEDELCGNEDRMETDLTEPPAASPAYSDISDDGESNPTSALKALHRLAHPRFPICPEDSNDSLKEGSIFSDLHTMHSTIGDLRTKVNPIKTINENVLGSKSTVMASAGETSARGPIAVSSNVHIETISLAHTNILTTHETDNFGYVEAANREHYPSLSTFPSQAFRSPPGTCAISKTSVPSKKNLLISEPHIKTDSSSPYSKDCFSGSVNSVGCIFNLQSSYKTFSKTSTLLQSQVDSRDANQFSTSFTSNGEAIS